VSVCLSARPSVCVVVDFDIIVVLSVSCVRHYTPLMHWTELSNVQLLIVGV